MEPGHHLLMIRIRTFIESHGIPAVLTPILPILNENIDWNVPLTKFSGGVENLLLARITLTTLPKAVRPSRQQRSRACEFSVLSDHLAWLWSIEKVVVNRITHFRPKGHCVRRNTHRDFSATPRFRAHFVSCVRCQMYLAT